MSSTASSTWLHVTKRQHSFAMISEPLRWVDKEILRPWTLLRAWITLRTFFPRIPNRTTLARSSASTTPESIKSSKTTSNSWTSFESAQWLRASGAWRAQEMFQLEEKGASFGREGLWGGLMGWRCWWCGVEEEEKGVTTEEPRITKSLIIYCSMILGQPFGLLSGVWRRGLYGFWILDWIGFERSMFFQHYRTHKVLLLLPPPDIL